MTEKCLEVLGKDPFSIYFTQVRLTPQGHLVLGLAGDGAGVASDTFPVVYDEAVLHGRSESVMMRVEYGGTSDGKTSVLTAVE